jgi:hypothetical protein
MTQVDQTWVEKSTTNPPSNPLEPIIPSIIYPWRLSINWHLASQLQHNKHLGDKTKFQHQLQAFIPKLANSTQNILQQKQWFIIPKRKTKTKEHLSLEQCCHFVVLPPHLAPSLVQFHQHKRKTNNLMLIPNLSHFLNTMVTMCRNALKITSIHRHSYRC